MISKDAPTDELTPLMRQYKKIKERYRDCILFFRLGDFYEMFFEDAQIASKILGITLTSRDKAKENPIPMCGIPFFSAENYIDKLISAGYKVAICEQIGDPKQSKGIVERDVIKVLTPGTYLPEGTKENLFIMSAYLGRGKLGIAVADVTTGQLLIYESERDIIEEFNRFEPKEVLIPSSLETVVKLENIGAKVCLIDDWKFDYSISYRKLAEHFKVASLRSFGVEGLEKAVASAGVLIDYLEENRQSVNFRGLRVLNLSKYMLLDSTTKRNLEIFQSLEGIKEGSLFWILDHTMTPMGTRFLKNALAHPLLDKSQIELRLNCVEAFYRDTLLRQSIMTILKDFPDIERLSLKLKNKTINPRELNSLKEGLKRIPKIKEHLSQSNSPSIKELSDQLQEVNEFVETAERALTSNPPVFTNEGGIFREGFNREIDELRKLTYESKQVILSLEAEERRRTGINSLKIGYNKVFGYYIEVTKANLNLVPSRYIRKQTLVNVERFITEELKNLESQIIGAEERLKALERELYEELIGKLEKFSDTIGKNAETIGYIDFILSLSESASRYDYHRPEITEEDIIEVVEGRHPVIERLIQAGTLRENRFIPNDLLIGTDDQRIMIITGPNMAGKSTYMRQNALIVLMAQIGSFVPASRAKIGLVDRIFTRIGASDYLSKGQSTFMVEMIETANILNNATSKSLIILDEVGRGTSTFDGISIAWAVVEYIAEKLKARTLFATHYHELTELALSYDSVKNYNVVVKEWGDEIIFLRKIEKGGADKSYGIQVARLAGLPAEILSRAKEVLERLEKKEFQRLPVRTRQLDLFFQGDPIAAELAKIDIDNLSPKMALKKLKELKEMLSYD